MVIRTCVVVLGLLVACGGGGSAPAPEPVPQLGDPNPGLSIDQRETFERGLAVFERRFTRTEGHGPEFNTSSCRSCHSIPTTGGSAPLYRNFQILGNGDGGGFQPVLPDGRLVLRNFSYERSVREPMPADATIKAQRNAPPMFGLGLLERIDDFDIIARHDPNDADRDGISGRMNIDDTRIGRFGYKAQSGSLVAFVRGPIFNHMGITTDPLRIPPGTGFRFIAQQNAPETSTTDEDGSPDPELSNEDLFDLVFFVRELAPPAPLPMDAEATRGEALFDQVGCAACHVPNLVRSGDPVFAYTDLLLHDMGDERADGVRDGVATGREFRTAPLWGLRHHAPYLHDGRADTVDAAIRLHGGEAQSSRDAYVALSPADRAAILAFLETR
ncbi:MAG: di-heme oxidoredictase family protein [Planctomycetota bacterium]